MIRNDVKAEFFDNLVNSERGKVIGWLKQHYDRIPYAECEDIFQEASMVFWNKFASMEEWNGEPVVGMLFRICRNTATHHLQKLHDTVEWDGSYLPEESQVETDFGFVSPDVYQKMRKEQLYGLIDHLAPADRELMHLYLGRKKLREIRTKLGFKSDQVVKNRKCKIVARLRKEIGGQVILTCPLFLFRTDNRGSCTTPCAGGLKIGIVRISLWYNLLKIISIWTF